ncbi:alpha/beta fold hydrolase [Microvirga brassicacearum]|nr:alpha/beta hydrolase [Microvirga brassicacearum]
MRVRKTPLRAGRITLRHSSDEGKIAAGLFSAATAAGLVAWGFAVHLKAKRAERDNPPIGRFIDVGGVRLHYLDQGKGDPIVLLHGNGSMVQDFVGSGLVDFLAERYRVIVFDRPGFGYSERPRHRTWTPAAQAELLTKALRRLGVEETTIIGHSWGTLPAIEMALLAPDQTRGLVLLSGHYYPEVRLDVAILSTPAFPVVGDALRYTISPALGRLLANRIIRRLFAPRDEPPEFRTTFPVAMALRPSQLRASAAESGLMLPVNSAAQKRYSELTMPIAIIAGAEDRIVSVQQSRRLHENVPDSALLIVPEAGHMVHYASPSEVVKAVDDITSRSSGG